MRVKRAGRAKQRVRIGFILLAILIILIGSVGYVLYNKYEVIVKNPMSAFTAKSMPAQVLQKAPNASSSAGNTDIPSQPTEIKGAVTYNGEQYTPNASVINILLLGIDTDATRQAEDMGWRSDMIVLCTIDFSADTMNLTAIPRDTRTRVTYVDKSSGKVTKTVTDKINAAYSYGGGPSKFSAQNAEQCVSSFLSVNGKYDVPIDYFISIDLGGIPKFASALGGIKLPLDVNFPGLGKKGQMITLNEQNAIVYLSNRKQVGGDLVRDSHEQQYMIAVAKKIKEEGAVAAAPKLYASLSKFMKTNLSLEQILAVADVLDKMSIDNVNMQIIGGNSQTIDAISYYIADMKDVESKVIQLMYTPLS